jgi:hypothetical protein
MAKPPAGYTLQEGLYFTTKGAGGGSWDGSAVSPSLSDIKPPAGYTFQDGAYFTDDGQGPYTWDGSVMTLIT